MNLLDVKTHFQPRALRTIHSKQMLLLGSNVERQAHHYNFYEDFRCHVNKKKKQEQKNYVFHSAVDKLSLILPSTRYIIRPRNERPVYLYSNFELFLSLNFQKTRTNTS